MAYTVTLVDNLRKDAQLEVGTFDHPGIAGTQVTPVGANFGDTIKAGDSVTLDMQLIVGSFLGTTGFIPTMVVPIRLSGLDPQRQSPWESVFTMVPPGEQLLEMNASYRGSDRPVSDASQTLEPTLDPTTVTLNVSNVTCKMSENPSAHDCLATP